MRLWIVISFLLENREIGLWKKDYDINYKECISRLIKVIFSILIIIFSDQM